MPSTTPPTSVPPRPPALPTLRHFTAPADLVAAAQLLAEARTTVHPAYHRRPGDCFALYLRAEALDVPVGLLLDHMYVNMNGTVGLSAWLMTALLQRASITITPTIYTDQVVQLKFSQGRRKLAVSEYRITTAAKLGLTKQPLWRAVPDRCLYGRALSQACRDHFAGIVLFGLTREEARHAGTDPADPADTDEADEPVSDDVLDLLDRAADATVDDIRRVLIPAAKKQKILTAPAPGGRTLGRALHDAALLALARDADTADQEAAGQPNEPPVGTADDTISVSAGSLPCGCAAADIAAAGDHPEGGPGC
jgi:hypothetical protein